MVSVATLQAVLSEVWSPEDRRYADLRLINDPPAVLAWRRQGDNICYALQSAGAQWEDNEHLVRRLDMTVQAALARLPILTDSDALIAGERRRFRWIIRSGL